MSKDTTPNPDVIAQSFIKQYYEMMTKNPSELHKFYMEESHFLFCENNQKCDSIYGSEAIREQISRLNLTGASFVLAGGSVDAQASENAGILVTVTGLYTPAWNPETKSFTQTFFLAKKLSTYFVMNSVFRVVQELRYPLAPHRQGSPHPSPEAQQAYFAAVQAAANGFPHPHFLPPPPMLGVPLPGPGHHPEYGHGLGHFQHGPAPTVIPPAFIEPPVESPVPVAAVRRPSLPRIEEVVAEETSVDATPKAAETPAAVVEGTPSPAEIAPVPALVPAAAAASPATEDNSPAESSSNGGKSYADMAKRMKAAAAAGAATAVAPAPGAVNKQQAPRVVVTSTVQGQQQNAKGGNKAGSGGGSGRAGSKDVVAKPAAAVTKPSATASSDTAGSSAPAQQQSNSSSQSQSGAPREHKPVFTLYVSQLPENATLPEMKAIFGQYGELRSIDLPVNRTYAFVKYDSVDSMNAALAASKSITYQGKPIRMEERKATTPTASNNNHSSNNNNNYNNNKMKPLQQNTRLQGLTTSSSKPAIEGSNNNRDNRDRNQQRGGSNSKRPDAAAPATSTTADESKPAASSAAAEA